MLWEIRSGMGIDVIFGLESNGLLLVSAIFLRCSLRVDTCVLAGLLEFAWRKALFLPENDRRWSVLPVCGL